MLPKMPDLSEHEFLDVNGFRLFIEEYDVPQLVKGRPENGKAYRIGCVPVKPAGYYHCGYSNIHDARTVLSRISDRFDMQTFNVNFSNATSFNDEKHYLNPVHIRDHLDK